MPLELLDKQREFVEAPETEVIFSGGYGAGKSVSLCIKAVFVSLRYSKNRIFMGRKILNDFLGTTYKTLLDGDGELPPILPKNLIVDHNKTLRSIKLVNGSEIVYGDVDVEKIKSMNLGGAFIDECGQLSSEEWDAFLGRRRLAGIPVRQICGSTNPYSEYHWIWNRFKLNPSKDSNGNPTSKFVQMRTDENWHLAKDYIEELKNKLFGFYYQRYVEGKWVGADSLIFDNYVPEIHEIDSFDIPDYWPKYRSVDFGFRSPYACGWFTVVQENWLDHNPPLKKGDVIMYREYYYTQRTSAINAQKIKEYSVDKDGNSENYRWTVCDWDAGDRADLEAVGIKTTKADKKDKLSRLNKVKQALGNSNPNTGIIVKPSFYIFKNSLIEEDHKIRFNFETGEKNNDPVRASQEFMAYSWKPQKIGQTKDEPMDKFDHAMDMIGYFFQTYQTLPQWLNIDFKHL